MIGRVPEFESKKEDFDSYLERFERWLSANEIDAGKKADVFLSVLGSTEYGLLKNLIAPQKVTEVSYDDITRALSLHFKSKSILTTERFRFYKRQQKQDETVAEYIIVLKKLVCACEFGQFLNDALRDQFVCGLSGEGYHKRLLSEKDLTFKKASDIALALELAYKDTKELREHADKPKGAVHKSSTLLVIGGITRRVTVHVTTGRMMEELNSASLQRKSRSAIDVARTIINQLNATIAPKHATAVEKSDI